MSNRTALRMRVLPRFPARITGADGITVDRDGLDVVVRQDTPSLLQVPSIANLETAFFQLYDQDLDSYSRVSADDLLENIQDVIIGETLAAIDETTPTANQAVYFTAEGEAAVYNLSAAGRALLDDADAAAMRTTLGLGGSSTLSVGTTAGTVAAGDDSRIVNAVQTSRTLTAGTGLTGGGDLSANRTLALNSTSITSLALADTSVQPARTVSAGTGLTGGGSLAADRTIALSAGSIASLALADSALQVTTGRMQFADRTTAAAATVPASVYSISLQAYLASESTYRGAANYRIAASDAEYTAFPAGLKFTTANSRKFVAFNLDNSTQAGVIGDGVGDDYARLQAYADYCGYTGRPFILADSPQNYRISQKLVFKTTRQLSPVDTTPGSDIHFSDDLPFLIQGEGKAKIVATAAMTSMIELIFNTALSNIGPFYTWVNNLHLNGGGLATSCIKSDYSMNLTFTRNRLEGATRGIEYSGYGVFKAEKNVIRCKYGFYLLGGGGDSTICYNDFYAAENNCADVYLGYYGGNVNIYANVFSNDQNFSPSYCVQMAGGTAAASEEIRDVRVNNNEFCGYTIAVRVDGKASGNKNVWSCMINDNHVNPMGANSYGSLLYAVDATDFQVYNNELNGLRRVVAISAAITLVRCERFQIEENWGGNYNVAPFYDQDGVDNEWKENVMDDVGKLGASYTIFDKYGVGTVRILRNTFRQSNVLYAQNGIYERDSANNTIALDNIFSGVAGPHRKAASGTASVIKLTRHLSAAPTGSSITYNIGDEVINTVPTAGGVDRWRCTTAGAPGTWKAVALAA